MTAFFTGFSVGFSLILAIGAQNAFVLRQGLMRQHVFWICLTCAVSDAILIAVGVFGFTMLSDAAPMLAPAMRWLGAAFLLVYGGMALRSAWRGTSVLMAQGEGQAPSLRTAILTLLMLTWLNPHVYLDTIVLIGSIATRYPGAEWQFGTGAALSSFVFFFLLGFGAHFLAPVFHNPSAWRVLDLLICLVMWSIAVGLVLG